MITHSWNGTVLTITSDSGTSSVDLRGEMGVRGPQGPAGMPGRDGENLYYNAYLMYDEETEQYSCNTTANELYERVERGESVRLVDDRYVSCYYLPVYVHPETTVFVHLDDTLWATVICVGENGYVDYVEYPLAFYNKEGNLQSNEPVDEYDVATKAYVDNNFVKGKKYELIETITAEEEILLERTQEPDGTPYKFERLAIKVNATPTQNFAINFMAYCMPVSTSRINGAQLHFETNTNVCYGAVEFYQDNGYWRAVAYQPRAEVARYRETLTSGDAFFLKYSIDKYPYLDRVRGLSAMPTGTVIEIWGVRADA